MSINLLPWREIRLQKKYYHMLLRLIIYAIIFYAFVFVTKLFLLTEVNHITIKTHNIRKNIQKITLLDPQNNNARLLNQLKILFSDKNVAIKNNTMMMDMLSEITQYLPNSITLTQLSITNKKINLSGAGNHLSDIHQFDFALQNTHWKHITLSDIHHDEQHQPQIDFSIRMSP